MYQQSITGVAHGMQSNLFSSVSSTGRVSAVRGVGGPAAGQASSMQIMRVYVIQEAPKTFIRSHRAALAQGNYREGGEPGRYAEWAGQENLQSSVTGLRQWQPNDSDFIQKHLDRLTERSDRIDSEGTAKLETVDDDTAKTSEKEQAQTERREPEDTAGKQSAEVERQAQQTARNAFPVSAAGLAGAYLVR